MKPPAGVEPAPRPYKGRVLAVDTTEAWRRRPEAAGVSAGEADRAPIGQLGLRPARTGTRACPSGRWPSRPCALEPGLGLVGRERGRTRSATRTGPAARRPGGGCRSGSFVVTSTRTRRPWPIRPSTTFSSRDRPWPVRSFASAASSSPVSSRMRSRQRLAVVVVVVLVQQHVEHVRRARAEERLRVGDVVEVAPRPPLPAERPQRVGLAGARLAVPEEQPAAEPRARSSRPSARRAAGGRRPGSSSAISAQVGTSICRPCAHGRRASRSDQNVIPIRCRSSGWTTGYHSRSHCLAQRRGRRPSARGDAKWMPLVLEQTVREALLADESPRSTSAVREPARPLGREGPLEQALERRPSRSATRTCRGASSPRSTTSCAKRAYVT